MPPDGPLCPAAEKGAHEDPDGWNAATDVGGLPHSWCPDRYERKPVRAGPKLSPLPPRLCTSSKFGHSFTASLVPPVDRCSLPFWLRARIGLSSGSAGSTFLRRDPAPGSRGSRGHAHTRQWEGGWRPPPRSPANHGEGGGNSAPPLLPAWNNAQWRKFSLSQTKRFMVCVCVRGGGGSWRMF